MRCCAGIQRGIDFLRGEACHYRTQWSQPRQAAAKGNGNPEATVSSPGIPKLHFEKQQVVLRRGEPAP